MAVLAGSLAVMLTAMTGSGSAGVWVAGRCAAGSGRSLTIACVAGRRLEKSTFDHWMYITAKASASQAPNAPVIVPTDPPRFSKCIASARRKIPALRRVSRAALRAQCATLFRSLDHDTLGFIVRAEWFEREATRDRIVITDAHVRRVFERDKHEAYQTEAAFHAFLRQTGQTVGDILFRVRANLSYGALFKRFHGHSDTLERICPRALAAAHFLP